MPDEQEILRLATTDPVTGLHNNAYFLQEAERSLRRALRSQQPLSILLLSIDGLPEQNFDRAAAQLRKSVRATDFVARREGSEFALLLPDTSGVGAELVGEKLRAAIAAEMGPQYSAIIGIATFPENGGEISLLLIRTKEAQNLARASGTTGVLRSKYAATVKIPAWLQRRFSAGQGESLSNRPSGKKNTTDDKWTKTRFETGDKPLVSNEWTVALGGWRLENEEWVSESEGNNILIWNLPVPGSFRYACEGWNEGPGEISVLGRAYEGEQSAHWGYAFHVGADNNSCAKFTRLGSTALALPGCTVEPQQRYRLEIEYDELENVAVCYLDGKRVFEYRELLPFAGNQVGLYAWGPGAHLRPLEVRAQKTNLSAMELADDFFELKEFKTAQQCYNEIALRMTGRPAALQAKLKSALCLAHMDRLPQARRELAALKGTDLEPFALGHEALFYFQNRSPVNWRNTVDLFEDLLTRFPTSTARQLIVSAVPEVRLRTRRFGTTRVDDLKVRARMNRLARDSGTPSYAQIRSAIELGRVRCQMGEWQGALKDMLEFQQKLSPSQLDVADFRVTSYVMALANNRDDLLPENPSISQVWEVDWFPDWCTGIAFHAVIRKGDPIQFIDQYYATVAEYPALAQSIDLKHAVMLLYLARNGTAEAAEVFRTQLLPSLNEDSYFWHYWVGSVLIDSRQDVLIDEFLQKMSALAQRQGAESNMARALSILKARRALEDGNLPAAAKALEGWPVPELIFHFSEGLVLQTMLSSLGLLHSPAKLELEESIDSRLGGAELQLAEIFMRKKDPRPNELFPHPKWRPEFRLWLALWLEAKGDHAGARSVAEPCVDERYGLTHSQPALKALLERVKH